MRGSGTKPRPRRKSQLPRERRCLAGTVHIVWDNEVWRQAKFKQVKHPQGEYNSQS